MGFVGEEGSEVLSQEGETFGSVGQEQPGPRDFPMRSISNSMETLQEPQPSALCRETCHQDVPHCKGH
jgi:hypothetical protein